MQNDYGQAIGVAMPKKARREYGINDEKEPVRFIANRIDVGQSGWGLGVVAPLW